MLRLKIDGMSDNDYTPKNENRFPETARGANCRPIGAFRRGVFSSQVRSQSLVSS